MIRKIIQIDSKKCNGCGACATACHEGAIAMVDGKARLMRDDYCDGLGDCLPHCPTDAITFVEREAAAYDEEAVKQHMAAQGRTYTGRCPGSQARSLGETQKRADDVPAEPSISRLSQWPPAQARTAPYALFQRCQPAHRCRLHGLCLRPLPRRFHQGPHHPHRLS